MSNRWSRKVGLPQRGLIVGVLLLVVGVAALVFPKGSFSNKATAAGATAQTSQERNVELRKRKEQFEAAERAQYREAARHPRAPKPRNPPPPVVTCPTTVGPPVVERTSEAVPGVKASIVTQTRLAYDGTLYSVFSGVSTERPDQGVIVVLQGAVDPCANGTIAAGGAVLGSYFAGAVGAITIIGVNGTVVEFQAASGARGSFDVVTKRFAA